MSRTITLSCLTGPLSAAVRRVSLFVDPKNSITSATALQVRVEGGKLVLRATDLFTQAEEIFEPLQRDSDAAVLVPPKKLVDALALVTGERVELTIAHDDSIRVRGQRNGSKVDRLIRQVCLSEFAPAPMTLGEETGALKMWAEDLREIWKRIGWAAPKDGAREPMEYLDLLRENGRLDCLASDGHRAAICRMSSPGKDAAVLVPRRAFALAIKAIGKCPDDDLISLRETQSKGATGPVVELCWGALRVISKARHFADTRPPWRSAIHIALREKVKAMAENFDPSDLCDAAKQVAKVVNADLKGCGLGLRDGEICLWGDDADLDGEIRICVQAEAESSATTGINPRYLAEAISAASKDVAIKLLDSGGKTQPSALVESHSGSTEILCYIMPMNLKQ